MFKKSLSILAIMTAGAGMALGQDAASTGYPAARLQTPAPYSAYGSDTQPVTPPGRTSPYGNYSATGLAADAGAAVAGPTGAPAQMAPMGGGCANGGCANGG